MIKLKKLLFPKKYATNLISIYINRDSVCMGDDCESHETAFQLNENATLGDLLHVIKKMSYLAQIRGKEATWLVYNLKKVIAIVAQQWKEPKYLSLESDTKLHELETENGQIKIHFRYLAQQNPDIIYNQIKNDNQL